MRNLRRHIPSMNGLFTFEAAARCGSFSRAAEELNVTPAAVSRMVARLEEHLDIRLFDRAALGVALTASGRILFDAITAGFSGIDAALREIEDSRHGVETVTLSVSTGFTTHWMMPRMAQFKKAFPRVELRFQLVMGAVVGPVNDVDLGMRFISGVDDRHEASLIMPETFVPICTPDYLAGHDISKGGHEALTTINLTNAAQPNWSDLFFGPRPGESAGSLIFSDYSIVVQAALLGQGVALGWLNVVGHWLRTGALVPATGQALRTERLCSLLRLKDKPVRPIVGEVRDWLVAELRNDVREIDRIHPRLELMRDLKPM